MGNTPFGTARREVRWDIRRELDDRGRLAIQGGVCPVVEHQGAVLLHGQHLHPEEVGRREAHQTRL